MGKYRLKPYDMKNDLWVIEKKHFWFLWVPYSSAGAGTKALMIKVLKELEAK